MARFGNAKIVQIRFSFAVQSLVNKCRLTYLTLTYNHFLDASYMADVCMGPMFWFVDNFTNTIGVVSIS